MKKINILYWVFTALLVILMLLSAIPSILNNPDSAKFMVHLGYPPYFGRYLGVAKILGIIAILVPGFPRIKEWAYAGFTFDLISALYSFIAVGDPVKSWILFPLFFIILAGSYIYYHKRLKKSAYRDVTV